MEAESKKMHREPCLIFLQILTIAINFAKAHASAIQKYYYS